MNDARHRWTLALATLIVAMAAAAPMADAAIDRYGGQNPIRKLGRGLANTFTSIVEVPVTISQISAQEGPIAGFTLGTLYGAGSAVTRTVVGIAEVLTFPFPLPDIGYGPILLPEFLLNPAIQLDQSPP